MPETPHAAPRRKLARRRLNRRHVLMLILACEVVAVGVANADRYRPPGITVEQTVTHGNVIT
ncbi:hypothetical protein SAMN04488125_10795 [Methylorubrum salsuginis]|uniref:Uncharacterized protein n=2 Tax=Methylorubrum salsuginis TaxID=414703 RepID=A0A1I4E8V5_9HYPH|nr:hypothetical protein SAMN04488125_10795 [Methylorubrum salsuginis]